MMTLRPKRNQAILAKENTSALLVTALMSSQIKTRSSRKSWWTWISNVQTPASKFTHSMNSSLISKRTCAEKDTSDLTKKPNLQLRCRFQKFSSRWRKAIKSNQVQLWWVSKDHHSTLFTCWLRTPKICTSLISKHKQTDLSRHKLRLRSLTTSHQLMDLMVNCTWLGVVIIRKTKSLFTNSGRSTPITINTNLQKETSWNTQDTATQRSGLVKSSSLYLDREKKRIAAR